MKKYFLILLAFSLFACDSFVNDYTEPNDSIGDDQFKTAGDAQFLITGVRGLFAEAYDQATSLSGGLSDELRFTRDISGASFVTFDEIDRASTLPPLPVNIDNNSITGFYLDLHRFRKHTELLIDKTNNSIVFEEGEESIKASALYTGYFYSAIAKYMLGAYFGLEIDQPGNVIDAGLAACCRASGPGAGLPLDGPGPGRALRGAGRWPQRQAGLAYAGLQPARGCGQRHRGHAR